MQPGAATRLRMPVVGLMILRAVLASALSGVLVAAPLHAQGGKIWRLGVLGLPTSPYIEAFRQGLRELGYVEGQNVVFEYRWEDGKPERLSALAADLVRLKVDMLLAPGTAAALAAKMATKELPIVFATVADPVGSGLVATLARPGGNVTGPTTSNRELQGKRFDLLRQALPQASRFAFLFSASDPSNVAAAEPFKRQALAAGLTVELHGVRAHRDIGAAFAAMRSKRIGALMVTASPFLSPLYAQIVEHAAQNKLPAMYSTREPVEMGGLMSYAPSLRDQHRRAAAYVDKICKGAKPADLPVEQPTRFELVINLKTAKALGLIIPSSLLVRADQIIE
jgi:ABC-type uncharacterized transport system substrate-binding protein